MQSVERLETVERIIDKLKATYPDAKVFGLEIRFAWEETSQQDIDNALCPIVKIHIER